MCKRCLETQSKFRKSKREEGNQLYFAQRCEHLCFRATCKECKKEGNGGTRICEHNRRRYTCKECKKEGTGGSCVCEHNKIRLVCRECDFGGYFANEVRRKVQQRLKCAVSSSYVRPKKDEVIDKLECTIDAYKEYIEKQFTEGMTWENFGKDWEIDHVIAIKYKKDGQEPSINDIYSRLHFTNTQPLWRSENRSKKNT
jgi:hypothetical protein